MRHRFGACLVVLTACSAARPCPSSLPSAPPRPVEAVAPKAATSSAPAAPSADASQEPPLTVDARTARLMRLCRIWGDVRYLDPAVAAGTIDWDAALEAALPKALDAKTDDEEAAAVGAMLAALHDPATYVERRPARVKPARPPAPRTTATRVVDGVLVARIDAPGWSDVAPVVQRLSSALEKTKLAVLDVRGSAEDASWAVLKQLGPKLIGHDTSGLASVGMEYHGYRPQDGMTSGGYETLLTTYPAEHYAATTAPHPSRVVFVADARGAVPDVAWAMRRTGDAVIVADGPLAADEFAATRLVPLGGDWVAHLRQAVLDGRAPQPDLTLDASLPETAVIEAAVHAAQHPPAHKRATAPASRQLPTELSWRPDARYADSPYPSRERRLLALFRFWNAIERFYPYLHLMGDGWNRAFVDFLPRFESAANAREYALAIAEMATRIPDGHVGEWGSPVFDELHGKSRVPFDVQVLDGKVVVTELADPPATGGPAVGDLIVAVNGTPIGEAMQQARKYLSGSNESYLAYRSAYRAMDGGASDPLTLTVQDASGKTHDVSVKRTPEWSLPRRGPVYRLLDADIGYADLDRLENKDVDAMFAAFEKTKAIVFDMRGYPHGTAWTIAPRLNVRHTNVAAQFFEPQLGVNRDSSTFFEQPIPPTDKPLYRGQTVMLIDERTMSQAEHTGLFFEAANGTKFIGSQTAGANGDVTNLVLPGGIFVSFSGHDVRHADGRQLQRVGLKPDIWVRPTIEGIRAGRDEVLERALTYVRTGQ